ncbi:kinesin-like nuclear fusion protein [Apophysomyces sp. BC1034]|nr:kinesin-like nuclear fusion protein [Apophysomyces sp. BC1015]KAG0179584.1 kinesin-like nuclear fusion protein [Apophysomyces sp. BC1021]KAG0189926.1 kinesin-like nuclear fusion protein [Apophysomyces sp. BC1034]
MTAEKSGQMIQKRKAEPQPRDTARNARLKVERPKAKAPIVRSTVASRASSASIRRTHSSVSSSASASTSTSITAKSSPAKDPATGPKKRQSWDMRGKINDMEELLEKDQSKIGEEEHLMQDLQSTVTNKESQAHEAIQRVAELEVDFKLTVQKQSQEIEGLKMSHKAQSQELENENQRNKKRMVELEEEFRTIQDSKVKAENELQNELAEKATLRATIAQNSASFAEVEAELRILKQKLERSDGTLFEREKAIEKLKEQLTLTKGKTYETETRLLEEETTRRRLHNTIQELKGNIRVFCRVRPLLDSERAQTKLASMQFYGANAESLELSEEVSSTLGKITTKSYPFTFDKVFSPASSQQECFDEISQLVQSALDGYNVCIFAYGQTGSGKTYTMEGPPARNKESAGMIPRATQQIYDVAQKLNDRNWNYTMEGQFMEIYNETIHDLLGDASEYGKIKHEIRHEKNGNTTVLDMTTVMLDSPAKVITMLKKASQNRATGATNMNERSSRSHSVFKLRLSGYNSTTKEQCEGVLNLIDLAGSERLSMSGSTGDRLRETQAINKSLSCLGDVIHALVNNREGRHIPYRNSKLTYLLQNSLGGNSKTLMFVNVSPLSEHFNETLCSLRFATKVNSCQIGTAKKIVVNPHS